MSDVDISTAKTAGAAAAMWWASVLHERDVPDLNNPLLRAALAAGGKVPPAQDDALLRFANILANRLNQQLTAATTDPNSLDGSFIIRWGINLKVDYHPKDLLAECARQAGFNGGISEWPSKTTMFVKPNEVSVSYGEGSPFVVIWRRKS